MFLSVTLPKKKFQLFQPIGGVCATCTCGAANFAFGAAGVCDTAVNAVSARAAIESEANARMVDPRRNEFRENSMPGKRFRQFRASLRMGRRAKVKPQPAQGR